MQHWVSGARMDISSWECRPNLQHTRRGRRPFSRIRKKHHALVSLNYEIHMIILYEVQIMRYKVMTVKIMIPEVIGHNYDAQKKTFCQRKFGPMTILIFFSHNY